MKIKKKKQQQNLFQKLNTPSDYIKKRKQGKIIQKKTPLSKQIKKSISMLIFTLIFLIIMISLIFLMTTTKSGQKGYTLKQEQLRKDQLLLEQRILINKIINARSLKKIEDSEIYKNMIKEENPIYIDSKKKN